MSPHKTVHQDGFWFAFFIQY